MGLFLGNKRLRWTMEILTVNINGQNGVYFWKRLLLVLFWMVSIDVVTRFA